MEAIAQRLSHLDSQAEGALRVIMFYDTLMRRRVDLGALGRASAALAECVTGIRLHGTGHVTRVGPDGRPAPAADPLPAPSTAVPVTLDEEEIGTVWLERAGRPSSLDDLLLERLALAVAAVVERYGPARTTMADPALVELAVSPGSDEAARARALRLLGFGAGVPVRVVAVRARQPLDQVAAAVCCGRLAKAAPLTGTGVILAAAVDAGRFPAGVRAGIGGAGAVDASWQQARTALRFATPSQPVVHHDALGALALLDRIPPDAARENADVAAVARLAADPEDVRTLDAYCATGSLRRAAGLLHLHHSSVARRLEHIGEVLRVDLSEPSGLLRARLALTTWRLLED
ncbi:helix-turn-helix domain-containing protein [Streptomyces sp. 7-21]|uniref:helix-turn-helix domain-containing protein n=1 Tax=Streptomyces sp. 7-21 TaxID=2802283 RepID=UPI00191DF68A|nr:helix-turn-helix domain-containing protein [Streptomyces sp. 7-21]MBL1066900.1 helix-turn-helix domain-containing protein [Streptomyces sp. 7-21]